MNELTKNFPYSKEEFGKLIMTVELLTMNICNKAASKYPTQILQIQKAYQTLKIPLIVVWEHYGFGPKEEVMGLSSPLLIEAFKIEPENILRQFIEGMPNDNPFNVFGIIPHSEKLVQKMVAIYSHLLANIKSGRLIL